MDIQINWKAVAVVAGLAALGLAGYYGLVAPEQGERAVELLLGFFEKLMAPEVPK